MKLKAVLVVLREHMTIAACQDHRHGWMIHPDAGAELQATHAGHYHIREDDVEPAAIRIQFGERLLGIERQHTGIAQLLQGLGGELADADIVLDHEHTWAIASNGGLSLV